MNVDFMYFTEHVLYCIASAVTSDWIISLRTIFFRPKQLLHHFASRKRIEPADMTLMEACSARMSLLHPCQSVHRHARQIYKDNLAGAWWLCRDLQGMTGQSDYSMRSFPMRDYI